MRKSEKITSFRKIIFEYAKNNSKEYILVILIFIIGIFIGVMFINNCSENSEHCITTYISDFITNFKETSDLDRKISFEYIKKDLFFSIIIWLAGTTIIGMPIVFVIILFRGFCLGYTISAITLTIGVYKSLIFCLFILFLQNILFIPAVLTMGVSSIKLYKSIINDKRRDNIKIGIIRHTFICFIMFCIIILSCIIENNISKFFLKLLINKIGVF